MTYLLHHQHLKLLSILPRPSKKLNNNADYHLGAKYHNDPGGTMICQLKKYLKKLHENSTRLFNDNPPKDLEIILKIMEILITTGNPTLMLKEATDQHLNDLSRKEKQWVQPRGSNRIYL